MADHTGKVGFRFGQLFGFLSQSLGFQPAAVPMEGEEHGASESGGGEVTLEKDVLTLNAGGQVREPAVVEVVQQDKTASR